jgi:hypothetical protein
MLSLPVRLPRTLCKFFFREAGTKTLDRLKQIGLAVLMYAPDKGMNEQAMRQELLERARKGQLPGVTPEVMQRLEQQAGKK